MSKILPTAISYRTRTERRSGRAFSTYAWEVSGPLFRLVVSSYSPSFFSFSLSSDISVDFASAENVVDLFLYVICGFATFSAGLCKTGAKGMFLCTWEGGVHTDTVTISSALQSVSTEMVYYHMSVVSPMQADMAAHHLISVWRPCLSILKCARRLWRYPANRVYKRSISGDCSAVRCFCFGLHCMWDDVQRWLGKNTWLLSTRANWASSSALLFSRDLIRLSRFSEGISLCLKIIRSIKGMTDLAQLVCFRN